MHTYKYTYTRTSIHPYIHTYIHTYICTCNHTHTHIQTNKHTYIHTYIHTCYIYTYVHTYTHTHIHIYMNTFTLLMPRDDIKEGVTTQSMNESCRARTRSCFPETLTTLQHTVTLCNSLQNMGWLQLVGSLKSYDSFAEYCLFYRAFLQKRPTILRSLLIVATPYVYCCTNKHTSVYTHKRILFWMGTLL